MRYYILLLLLFSTFIALGQTRDYDEGIAAFKAQDYKKAFTLLKPFASSGDALAEYVVGFYYSNPNLGFKNDSLAEHFLFSSANQFNPMAMGLLSAYYFQKGPENEKYFVQALIWAEIASVYEPAYNVTATRLLIRSYLNESAMQTVESELKAMKSKFKKIDLPSFYALNQQMKVANDRVERIKIPENTYHLIKNPYADWVLRWRNEKFSCDTMYYTAGADANFIDSAVSTIKATRTFDFYFLYHSDSSKVFKITKEEQAYLIIELEKLKSYRWPAHMFPSAKRIEQKDAQAAFNVTEKLPTETEKNMCSIVYTFSKPIFIRNNTVALYLSEQRYRGNYPQLEFNFFKLENNRWQQLAAVYKFYGSPGK